MYFFSPVQDQALVHPLSTQAWYLKPEIFEIIFEKKLKKKTRKFFSRSFLIFFFQNYLKSLKRIWSDLFDLLKIMVLNIYV